jgi:tRNA threonylcarbamoyl adenosine modification protein YeaZ
MLLAFDTTFSACSVAVSDDAGARVLAAAHVAMDKGHAEALAPMVEACLAEAGVAPDALSRIAVTTGPGTFTGQRIGLALSHGMGVALGIPVVGINSLAATAAPLLGQGRPVCVVQQAGATGRFYALCISPDMTHTEWDGQSRFASADDVVAMAVGQPLLIGSGADAIMALAPAGFARMTGHDLPVAADFAALAATLPTSSTLPQPLYLREPDAKPSSAVALVTLRAAVLADVEGLSRLHGQCFTTGWSAAQFAGALSLPGAGALVLEADGGMRAFVQYHVVAGEAEINTLCVEPRWRKRGLAQKLLAGLDEVLRIQTVSKIHLDVADDNAAAQALYSKGGFAVAGRRKGYYARGTDAAVDAVLMTRAL